MTLVLTTCKPSPIEEGEGTTTGQDDGYIMLVFNEKKSANRDTSPDTDTESALSHLDSHSQPRAKKQLCGILQVMLYAHSASSLRKSAENTLAALR